MNSLNYKKILVFLLIGWLGIGCDKKLDIQPSDTVDASQALKTSGDVQGALVGAYTAMGISSAYGGYIMVQSDLLGDNGDEQFTGTYQQLTQIANKNIPVDNSFVTNTWTTAYQAINTTNNVLANLNLVDSAARDRVEGEAKFIRGTMYFELARLYAKNWFDGDPNTNLGVPLILTPTTLISEANNVGRSTLAATYAQVISDLQAGEENIPEENGFFATTYSASAMLSRVYLMQGKYAEAAEEANRVIRSGYYNLMPQFADEFPTPVPPIQVLNTKEDVFAIQVSAQAGNNSLNTFYASSDFAGRGDIIITQQHFDQYEEGDDRRNLFYDDDTYTSKFNNVYGNVKIIRLAEMYLTRAEANFREGTAVGDTPLNDINLIRARVNLPPLSEEELNLAAILHERKLELAFEGHFLHDVKRTKGSVGNLPWNSPKLVFPIPQRELDANPALKSQQNEGY